MRVLHICSGNLYGGVETLQLTLARCRNLYPQIEPGFAICFDGRLRAELAQCGVRVHSLGGVRIRNVASVLRGRARLRRLLAECRYDVAICHSAWTRAVFGPEVKRARIPLLLWLHCVPSQRHWLDRWARLTQPQGVIACSKFTANCWSNIHPEVPNRVIYPPVASGVERSVTGRVKIRGELTTPTDAIVIVQVSRMEGWKGHRLHIEALARLRDLPNWMCWFVGGPQRPEEVGYVEELRRRVEVHGIGDRIRFLGQRGDVAGLLAAADVFCQPNTSPEPFGIVFVEALLAGLPVVTTAMGGGLEVVDAGCGVLTPPGDAEALAVALRTLVGDSALRMRMSRAASARAVILCDPGQQIRRLSEVIESAVAANVA